MPQPSKAVDPMMASVYVPSSSNGESNGNGNSNPVSNGNGNGAIKPVGTGLKCLEDPSFCFDEKTETKPVTAAAAAPKPKKPTYRVLEDPFESGEAAMPKIARNDPMVTGMYVPSTGSASGAVPAPAGPPMAAVLEGAREKMDEFWGSKPAQ